MKYAIQRGRGREGVAIFLRFRVSLCREGGGGGRGGGVAFSVSPFSLPFFSSLFFFSFSRPAFASLETGNGNMNFKWARREDGGHRWLMVTRWSATFLSTRLERLRSPLPWRYAGCSLMDVNFVWCKKWIEENGVALESGVQVLMFSFLFSFFLIIFGGWNSFEILSFFFFVWS